MRRVWGGLTAAVGAVALAACGASVSPTTVVAHAPTRTTAGKTAKIVEQIAITPATGTAQHLTSSGVGDFATHRFDLTTTVGGQSIEVVLSGTTIYEKAPSLTSATSKPWVAIDLNAIGKLVGVNGLGNLVQSESTDPTSGLQFLTGATGPVTVVGHNLVRGVPTTHYAVTTSLDAAVARAPAAEQPGLRRFIASFGVHATVANVWIDGQGRVRRYHYTIAYRPTTATAAGVPAGALPKSVEVTTDLYDFGTAALISIPPRAQTANLSQVPSPLAPGAAPGNATATGGASVSTAAQALARLLLNGLPPGYQQAPDSAGQTGPSDLAKAADDDGGPAAKQVLMFDQFVAGYQRMWTRGNSQIIEFLYEFGTPRGAVAYGERQLAGDATAPSGDQLTPFAVPNIPGARGFAISGSDGPADVVLFTRAGFLVQIVINGTDASAPAAATLAAEQYNRLSG